MSNPGDTAFSWVRRKDGSLLISHHGRLASTLRGDDVDAFLAELERATPAEAQQLMARITGNYKRGNERVAQSHPRNRRRGA